MPWSNQQHYLSIFIKNINELSATIAQDTWPTKGNSSFYSFLITCNNMAATNHNQYLCPRMLNRDKENLMCLLKQWSWKALFQVQAETCSHLCESKGKEKIVLAEYNSDQFKALDRSKEDRPKGDNPFPATAADADSPPVIELSIEPILTHCQPVCHISVANRLHWKL